MSDFQSFLDETLANITFSNESGITNQSETYDVNKEIRDSIIALRQENHMTQKQLAAKTGLTQSNISNLEKGMTKPTIESLKKIADALGKRLVVDFVDQEMR